MKLERLGPIGWLIGWVGIVGMWLLAMSVLVLAVVALAWLLRG
jgi:hypothetical protein